MASAGRRRTLLIAAVLVLLVGAAVPAAFGQEVEPNNSAAQATPLLFPSGYINAAVTTVGDVDYYRFNAEAGNEITIWIAAASLESSLVPVVSLHDSTGRMLAYNESEFHFGLGQFTNDPIIYAKAPATDTYYIKVQSLYNFKTDKTGIPVSYGPYRLHLFPTFDSSLVLDGYEPNDTRQQAYRISTNFVTRYAELVYAGDIDWYTFDAVKGQKYSLDVDAVEPTNRLPEPFVVRTRLGIFDDAGHLLASTASAPDPDTGFRGDPAIEFTAPKSGKYYAVVTIVDDTTFAGAFACPEFLADPQIASARQNIGYYQFRFRLLEDMHFPHIANGDFGSATYSTTFLLVNTSDSENTGKITLYKSDGSPLEATFVPSGAAGSSDYFAIPAGGAVSIRTDGSGEGSSGYAVLTAGAGIKGSVVFSEYDRNGMLRTEAGVGTATQLDFFEYPVEIRGTTNTGVALTNLAASRANVTLKLVNSSGTTLTSKSIAVEPGTHMAAFVGGPGQLFPAVTDFAGTLQITSDLPLESVALRSSGGSLTTLPPTRLNQSYQPVTLIFPHVVVGPEYRSKLFLTNPGYFPVTGTVTYTRSDGSPMQLLTESRESNRVSFTVPALGSVFLQSNSLHGLETGFATLQADHGLGGLLVISQVDSVTGETKSEVGIPPADTATQFLVFAQNEEGFNTGLAVANSGSGTASLVYRLHPTGAGSVEERGPVALAAGRQRAELIAGPEQLFPDYTGAGVLEVTSSGPVPALALRISATTMTALPVLRIR